jgi:hypothetical protein
MKIQNTPIKFSYCIELVDTRISLFYVKMWSNLRLSLFFIETTLYPLSSSRNEILKKQNFKSKLKLKKNKGIIKGEERKKVD